MNECETCRYWGRCRNLVEYVRSKRDNRQPKCWRVQEGVLEVKDEIPIRPVDRGPGKTCVGCGNKADHFWRWGDGWIVKCDSCDWQYAVRDGRFKYVRMWDGAGMVESPAGTLFVGETEEMFVTGKDAGDYEL